jgi:ATP-dependent DNA ligase
MLSHRGNAGLSSILTDIASERRPEDPNEVIPTDPFLKQHYFTRNEFLIEEKIDGERIQIHVMGGGKEWQYHSRCVSISCC